MRKGPEAEKILVRLGWFVAGDILAQGWWDYFPGVTPHH
jgi:hypothetical protein